MLTIFLIIKFDTMIKILFIHHAAGWGGAPKCMVNLIKDLDPAKYEVEVLLLKDSVVASKLTEFGIKYSIAESVFYKKYYRFFAHSEAGYVKWYDIFSLVFLGISWILSRYYFADKELVRHRFDIVHLNSSVLTDWLAPAKKRGKVIIHIREPFRKANFDILHHFFKSQIRKYSDRIIAISNDNAKRIAIADKTNVIYDYCEISKGSINVNSYGSKKVLYLGGSSTSKGFYTIVKALDYLDKEVRIYFGGSYNISDKPGSIVGFFKYYLSNARKRNAAIHKIFNHPNAIVIGLIYNVNDYLNEVCCLISPFSVPHFSFPVVETHFQRKPAIVSDVEGMKEIVEDGKTGRIVPVNNPIALAEAINSIVSNTAKSKLMGEEGYRIAMNKFTPQNIEQFERVYNQLISK